LSVINVPQDCLSFGKTIYVANGDQISIFQIKASLKGELLLHDKNIATKYVINKFIPLGNVEDKLLCVANNFIEANQQIFIVKVSKNKIYATNQLMKDEKANIVQIIKTRDPMRYIIAADKGLFVITLVK